MTKKKIFRTNKAFTLVEMMIVVAIIGLLAFLSISAFGSANRSAKLDISVDTLVSIIRQQQGLAKSGGVDNSANAAGPGVYCYGVRFLTGSSDKQQIKLIKVPYLRLGTNFGTNKADYCQDIAPENLTDFASVTDTLVQNISLAGTSAKGFGQIDFLFKPPFAKALVIADESIIFGDPQASAGFDQNKDIEIILQSAFSDEQQKIIFSPAGGTVHKERITTPTGS